MTIAPSVLVRWVGWSVRLFALRLANFRLVLRTPARRTLEYDVLFHLWEEVRPRSVLFLGVASYTAFYHKLFPDSQFVTLDLDPACAAWGSPHGHVIGDAADVAIHWPPATFDTVVCNGIYGWGIDSPEAVSELLAGIRTVLVPGGFFVLGWNSGRETDPLDLQHHGERLYQGFRPATLAGREYLHVRSKRNHCFRFLRSV